MHLLAHPSAARLWLCFLCLLSLLACREPARLERLPGRRTGIAFNNQIFENDSFNILTHLYLYNGAGVGVADFDRDGQDDVFLAGNMVSSALYLNRGDFRFEEVTRETGIQTDRWCTGVSVVDINQDQWPDLYVCTIHPHPDSGSANYLFVNQGTDAAGRPRFVEQAEAYGLADTGYSTHAAFFDYDRDGDLDMYLVTNSAGYANRNTPGPVDRSGTHPSTDRLYRQEAPGRFRMVGREAGIVSEGWGLGVAIRDINRDGWPDIYVANDFISSDFLYINQRDGTFRDEIGQYFAHTCHNAMGIDMADINNDSLVDVVVVDMLPNTNTRQKAMFSHPNHNMHYLTVARGYQDQYVRNVLHLNYGNGRFGEIGQMAGVFQTDWSWAPLVADIDNDGWQDLLITNGYFRDITDMDYIEYRQEAASFGTKEAVSERLYDAMLELEPVIRPNFLYRNTGELGFEDVSEAWGFDRVSASHGVAYADFDGDGDLDWVINNMN
ncbi:MAG: VCBS repeat-containing protein, partial [Bacteroidetes bacterium]